MKFYLSSYKIGNETDKLKAMIPTGNRKVAYISNALDFSDDLVRRKQSEQADIEQLNEVGLSDIENIDLRSYFNKEDELAQKISEFGIIWARGGNCFVLRQAMRLSGFDNILKSLLEKDDILYGGYSAGICVLGKSLRGLELVDDANVKVNGDYIDTIWDGVGILDYTIIPHYRSDHLESAAADKVVEYMTKNKISFKTLRDGEVIVIE